MHHPDLCIAGAGIIGLSLALELHDRGYRVTVFDQGAPLAESSTAAAGMLAAHDPDNPPQLLSLASLSLSLYPDFLDRIHTLSGLRIPFRPTLPCSPFRPTPPLQTANSPAKISLISYLLSLPATIDSSFSTSTASTPSTRLSASRRRPRHYHQPPTAHCRPFYSLHRQRR
ncbi:FAD-dependent oxidoreductase [Tunturiibacter empetritectus]|uniref:FAD-dependent oxidoreductase n=1 Tax=Tunturiibacter empetritectus TaxID=3069691 RepID=UPI003D9B1CD1